MHIHNSCACIFLAAKEDYEKNTVTACFQGEHLHPTTCALPKRGSRDAGREETSHALMFY